MIKPFHEVPKQSRPSTRRLSIQVTFEVWLELQTAADPKLILNNLINDWFQARLLEKDTYVIEDSQRVSKVELSKVQEKDLGYLKNLRNKAIALGHLTRADAIQAKINALESKLEV